MFYLHQYPTPALGMPGPFLTVAFVNTLASIGDVLPHFPPLDNFYSCSKTNFSCGRLLGLPQTECIVLYSVFLEHIVHISTVALLN